MEQIDVTALADDCQDIIETLEEPTSVKDEKGDTIAVIIPIKNWKNGNY